MDELSNLRLRHASLSALYSHIKTYVECLERGYFGKTTTLEQKTVSTLRETMSHVDKTLWEYYLEESKFDEI